MSKVNHSVDDITQQVYVDQIQYLFRPFLGMVLSNTLGSFALAIAFWPIISQTIIIWYLIIMTAVTVFRLGVYLHYKRSFTQENVDWFARYFFIGSLLYGIVWGASGVLLFPDGNIGAQSFLAIMLVGAATIAIVTKSSWLPAIHAYLPLSLAPFIIQLFSVGEQFQFAIGLAAIAFLVVMYPYAFYANRDLINTFKLRYENLELVEQLRDQKEQAERANLSKSRFLAAASHDLRQPLHALTLFTSTLDAISSSPESKKVSAQISRSVTALKRLFDSLLDISRLDAGVMKVNKIHFMLQPVLQKLVNDHSPIAQDKGLLIRLGDCSSAVYTDIDLLQQILHNLLANAIRYTIHGEILIRCDVSGETVKIIVEDTGIGIPEAQQQLIFEEFTQLNNPERDRSKGLGLGLAIVKRTAKLLGHRIDLHSVPGEGSVFTVSTERGDENRATPAHTSTKPDTDLTDQAVSRGSILVIDDERDVREGTESLLHAWGYDVLTADSAENALEQLALNNYEPDIIIADYRLRESKTGVDAIHAIQDYLNADIPALIITGDIARERLLELNADGLQVLHKPIVPGKLRAFLRNTLSGSPPRNTRVAL